VIDLCDTVAWSLVANAPHRAALAILGLVATDQLHIAESSYPLTITNMLHLLSYRVDHAIVLLVIVQRIVTKGLDAFFFFFVKSVVLDIGSNVFCL
jgi:hypothetical protein